MQPIAYLASDDPGDTLFSTAEFELYRRLLDMLVYPDEWVPPPPVTVTEAADALIALVLGNITPAARRVAAWAGLEV